MHDDAPFLEHMTWPEVRELLAAGRTTVVVACGAVEQHGPHLPLFTDAEVGTWLAAEVARRLGAVVAPTIRVGCSEHHMAFPGTLTLRAETFEAVCRDYCTSLARHGFRAICFVPTHGGNFAPLAGMLERLNHAAGPQTRVLAYTDLLALVELWRGVVESVAPGMGGRVGGHADIAESSVILARHPELVRRDEACAGYVGELDRALLDRIFGAGLDAVTRNGILGDARGMSREIGELCVARLAERVAGQFAAELDE